VGDRPLSLFLPLLLLLKLLLSCRPESKVFLGLSRLVEEGPARMLSGIGPEGKLVGLGPLVLVKESGKPPVKLGSPSVFNPLRGWLDVSDDDGAAV